MSRHRNVRSLNVQEEYEGYDEVYGHSVEDDYCISPSTAAEFMYDRSQQHVLSTFMSREPQIPEEGPNEDGDSEEEKDSLQDSGSIPKPQLSEIQQAQLYSCLEEIRNILGDSTPDHVLTDAVIKANFDQEKALHALLNQQEVPKPQREQRNRRARDECFTNLTPTPPDYIDTDPTDSVTMVTGANSLHSGSPRGDINVGQHISGSGKSFSLAALAHQQHISAGSSLSDSASVCPGSQSAANVSNIPVTSSAAITSTSSTGKHIITDYISSSSTCKAAFNSNQADVDLCDRSSMDKTSSSSMAAALSSCFSDEPIILPSVAVFHPKDNKEQLLDKNRSQTGVSMADVKPKFSGLAALAAAYSSQEESPPDIAARDDIQGSTELATAEKQKAAQGTSLSLSALAATHQLSSSPNQTTNIMCESETCNKHQGNSSSLAALATAHPTDSLSSKQAAVSTKVDEKKQDTHQPTSLLALASSHQYVPPKDNVTKATTAKQDLYRQTQKHVSLAALASSYKPDFSLKPKPNLAAFSTKNQEERTSDSQGKPLNLASLAASYQLPDTRDRLSNTAEPKATGLAALAYSHRPQIPQATDDILPTSSQELVPSAASDLSQCGQNTFETRQTQPTAAVSVPSSKPEFVNPSGNLSGLTKLTYDYDSPTDELDELLRDVPDPHQLSSLRQISDNYGTPPQQIFFVDTTEPYTFSSKLSDLRACFDVAEKENMTAYKTLNPPKPGLSGLASLATAYTDSPQQQPKLSSSTIDRSGPLGQQPFPSKGPALNQQQPSRSQPRTVCLSALAAQHEVILKPADTKEPDIHSAVKHTTTYSPIITTTAPSLFGRTLCTSCQAGTHKTHHRSKSWFSYDKQMVRKGPDSPPRNRIAPFDFSTPSPDDIVKKKQKAAFGTRHDLAWERTSQADPVGPTDKPAAAQVTVPQTTTDSIADISVGTARMTFSATSQAKVGFNATDKDVAQAAAERGGAEGGGEQTGSEAGAKSGEATNVTPKKEASAAVATGTPASASKRSKQEKLNLKTEFERRQAGKENLNLVVIGHVDAGKSTLMGHVLYQLGFVNKRVMHKYEQEAKKMGKASFAYAWVLDETEEERSRGVTMDVAQTRFETDTKVVTLLDAPGHKDFIPNMITGAAQADVAILVVNATRGEFETGFELGGQTREHAMLIRSLGVSQLLVAVNKMDTVDWAKERYDEITKKLTTFLKQTGFKEKDVMYTPCSGLQGENLTKPASSPNLTAWYSGPHIVQQIDKFRPPERAIDKPLRLCVTDVFKGQGAGVSVAGTLQTGSVQTGDRVLVMPQGEVATIKSISMDDLLTPCAFAGDNILVTVTGIEMTNIGIGSILCDRAEPVHSTLRFKARVVIFNIDVPITKGFPVEIHYQSLTEPGHIRRLISQLHKSSGEIVRNKPRCLTKNSNAMIEIEVDRPICLELYQDYKDLGRFMLRSGGFTIAAGLVTEITDGKNKGN